MAFNRLATKLRQAVTDAEKTEMDPALKELLRQFEETKKFGDQMHDATKEALPIVGSSSKMTKVETLGNLMKQCAAKYGLEKKEAEGLSHGGDLLMAIGKVERTLLQNVEQNVYPLIKSTHDYQENLKKEKARLENAMTDMDGAKIKQKSGKGDQAQAQAATRAFETQKANVEKLVSALPEHRDKQRQAAKALAEALHEFYTQAAQVVEQHINSVG